MFQEKTEVRGEMVGLRVVVSENKGRKPGAMDLLFASPQTSDIEAQEVRSLADNQV